MTSSRLVAKSLSHPLTDPCQFDMIAQDKKVKRGKLTFILARAIGKAFIESNVSPVEVRAFLKEKLSE
jgi:3-dehydroquinate synthetase